MDQKKKISIKYIEDNSQSPTKSPPKKIKINSVSELPFDPSRSDYFKNLFQSTLDALQGDINIDALSQNGLLNYQVWNMEFRAEKQYENKKIYGQLRFPNTYPQEAPKFYFNQLNNQVLLHLNIYGDGLLCIPLLGAAWKPTTTSIDILEAIVHIFNNPNWVEGDAPANPIMGELFYKATKEDMTAEVKEQAQKELNNIYSSQAQQMKDWD